MSDRKYKVLFICTGNSARSIFAESILRKEAGDRFDGPFRRHEAAVRTQPLRARGAGGRRATTSPSCGQERGGVPGEEAPRFDFVFTVCDRPRTRMPGLAGQPVSAHWGMPDPVKAEGTDAEKALAFQQAYGALRNRIRPSSALPLRSLDRISLQRAVDDIGRTDPTEATHDRLCAERPRPDRKARAAPAARTGRARSPGSTMRGRSGDARASAGVRHRARPLGRRLRP
jgi:ArsR family transcriptional regulator, arsenate/arsenite/antimonite-responsive transcriptional repressor / arsenate reductase (thioredoxin)